MTIDLNLKFWILSLIFFTFIVLVITGGGFYYPVNCDRAEGTCDYGVEYGRERGDQNSVGFELFTKVSSTGYNRYVAVGFSEDQNMGSDGVSECVSIDGETPRVFLSYTTGKSTPERIEDDKAKEMLSGVSTKIENGYVICKFSRKIHPSHDKLYALNQDHYLLLAEGSSSGNFEISYHSSNRVSSDQKVNVSFGTGVVGGSEEDETEWNLKKAHGIFMVTAWLLLMALAIIFARYGRPLFQTKVFGLQLWFQYHRGLNSFGIIFIIVGLILILVAEDFTWTGPAGGTVTTGQLHSLFGVLGLVIAVFQPIGALFRCKPNHTRRPIFNWVHRLLGVAAWLLASVAIWLTTQFNTPGMDFKGSAFRPSTLLIFYWIILGSMLIGQEVLVVLGGKATNRAVADAGGMEMDDGRFDEEQRARYRAEKYMSIQKILIGCFGFIALLVVICLAVFIATENVGDSE